MTQDMNTLLAELETLRLPELKERYQQVLGTETRCPNRTFLIRSICNALRSEEATAAEHAVGSDGSDVSDVEEPAVPASAANVAPVVAPVTEPPSAQADALNAPSGRQRRPRAEQLPRGRFSSMTVEELQRKYVEVVGRDTGSCSKAYLVWKIREAEKGRIPVGPRQQRARDAEPTDVRILPLRLEADAVTAMDETWRTRGIKTRMEFLRRALGHYLAYIGASDAAAKFGTNDQA